MKTLCNIYYYMNFVDDIIFEGGQVYLVGGIVRDKLIFKYHKCTNDSKDYDLLICNITMETLCGIINKYGKIQTVGQRLGVIKFRDFDLALPRTEILSPIDNKLLVTVDPYLQDLPNSDLIRRDSTCNAIAIKINSIDDIFMDHYDDNVIFDPTGGIEDIKNKLWRIIGDPHKRFTEDPLRMMRAVRQCAQLNFSFDDFTQSALIDCYYILNKVNTSNYIKYTNELIKIIQYDKKAIWIQFILTKSNMYKFFDFNGIKKCDTIKLYKSISYCTHNNFGIHIKMAIVLYFLVDKRHRFAWTNKFGVAACPDFPSKYTKFIGCVGDDINILQKRANYDKLGNMVDAFFEFNEALKLETVKDKQKYKTKINMPIKVLNEYNIVGREIGMVKQAIYENIINGKIKNCDKDIIEIIKNYK